MFHQLSQSELADIRHSIELAEEGRQWLLRLHSLNGNRDKQNETEIKREESQNKVVPSQQHLSA